MKREKMKKKTLMQKYECMKGEIQQEICMWKKYDEIFF